LASFDLGTNQKSPKLKDGGTNLSETKHTTFYNWYGYNPAALDEVEIFIAHKSNKGELREVRAYRWCRTLCCYPVYENILIQHALVKEVA